MRYTYSVLLFITNLSIIWYRVFMPSWQPDLKLSTLLFLHSISATALRSLVDVAHATRPNFEPPL